MKNMSEIRRCAVCAWRAECRKRFCVPDGGARCPDFTRDVTLKETGGEEVDKKQAVNPEE